MAGFRKRLRETLSPYHADDISAADWERICEIDAEIKVLQEELDQYVIHLLMVRLAGSAKNHKYSQNKRFCEANNAPNIALP